MVNNDWKRWQENKLREQRIGEWTSRFEKADGNSREWQNVYRAYLQSDVWKEKRRQVLDRANGKCEKCGVILLDPDVHHLTYDRVGGNERLDDLMVLCFPCHRKADKQRDRETDERRTASYYQARLHGFATRIYGDMWWYEKDHEEIEIEFIKFLYKKYCEEYGLEFDPHLDPESNIDFMEFWNQVLNGEG